jgi:hypothetical protein
MRNLLIVIAVVAFVVPVSAEEKTVDNPTYKAWAAYKPGTTVKVKTVSDTAGNKSETIMAYKLLELTDAKAVVEMVVTSKVAGMEFSAPASKTDHPKTLKIVGTTPAPAPDKKPEGVVEEGEETVTMAGKEWKCKWYKTKNKTPVGDMEAKTWICMDLPGSVVKMESSMTGQAASKTTMELVEIKTP